jgi:hypothetical protein
MNGGKVGGNNCKEDGLRSDDDDDGEEDDDNTGDEKENR